MAESSGRREKPRLGCRIIAFNEEYRIADAIESAKTWADDVIVIDKGSTDRTLSICTSKGCLIGRIRFSDPGDESFAEINEAIESASDTFPQWYVAVTPSDILSSDASEEIKQYIASAPDDFAIGLIRARYFSFGDTGHNNPWSWGWTPRVINRKASYNQENKIDPHDPFKNSGLRTEKIRTTRPLIHQTHTCVDSFLKSHASYARLECRAKEFRKGSAIKTVTKYVVFYCLGKASEIQVAGFATYMLMKWLYSTEMKRGRDVRSEYLMRMRNSLTENPAHQGH